MSKIEWTEQTWNPIVGCSIVSPGCTNCYAMKMGNRLAANPATPHYAGTVKKVNGHAVWTGKVAMAPDRVLTAPLRRKKPTTYFVNSMGDLFHEDVPDEWIDRVFAVMALYPQHKFQVLTKRSKRMQEYFSQEGGFGRWGYIEGIAKRIAREELGMSAKSLSNKTLCMMSETNLPHLWLGVSAEDQARADERIPDLLATPAAVRFVSAEPLLGPIDFSQYLKNSPVMKSLTWLIVGGESGPGSRPMHPDWARSIRDQCGAADVPFFMKQMSGVRKASMPPIPPDLQIREMPDTAGTSTRAIERE